MSLSRLLVALILFAAPLRAQLIISEFLAGNSNSIMDEDGEHEDWIEIRNGGASAVSLLGWYLTDDSNQPRKWAFPSRTLNAGAFLVVFASDKDRTPGSGNLHTNFKLSANPGYLALTQDIAGGGVQVVQAFNPYPQQATDVAYGASVMVTNTALIASGAAAKTLVPTVGNGGNSLADAWKGAAANEPFNEAAWTAGTTAVGFANAGVATTNLKLRLNANDGTTVVTDTSGAGHNGTNNLATWVAEETDLAAKRGTARCSSTRRTRTARPPATKSSCRRTRTST